VDLNFLALTGPEFLQLYLGLMGLAVIVLALVRIRPGPWGEGAPAALSAEEVAYLQGGDDAVVDATLAGMLHGNVLLGDQNSQTVSRGVVPPRRDNWLESAVYAVVPATGLVHVSTVRVNVATCLSSSAMRSAMLDAGVGHRAGSEP